MNKRLKAQAVERALFTVILIVLGVGGFIYERWRVEMPGWRLPIMISGGYFLAYLGYRAALKWALRKHTF